MPEILPQREKNLEEGAQKSSNSELISKYMKYLDE